MKRYRTAVVSAFLVVSLVLAAGPAAGGVGTAPAASASVADNSGGMGLGANISSFMQASAADAEGDVETGMWEAGVENASGAAKAAMIEQRLDTLEDRLERLENRSESLDNETAGAPGRAASVRAQAVALLDSIDRTNETAAEFGVDANRSRVEDLRTRALALVEDIDRQGVAPPVPGDGPPGRSGTTAAGPPADAGDGPPANVSDGPPANVSDGPPANVSDGGPPADGGQDAGAAGNSSDGASSGADDGDQKQSGNSEDGGSGAGADGPNGSTDAESSDGSSG